MEIIIISLLSLSILASICIVYLLFFISKKREDKKVFCFIKIQNKILPVLVLVEDCNPQIGEEIQVVIYYFFNNILLGREPKEYTLKFEGEKFCFVNKFN